MECSTDVLVEDRITLWRDYVQKKYFPNDCDFAEFILECAKVKIRFQAVDDFQAMCYPVQSLPLFAAQLHTVFPLEQILNIASRKCSLVDAILIKRF